MKHYEGRQQDLKNKLNKHLTKLTGQEEDYYQALSQADLAELKTVLSDINNIFTLKLTLSATAWLCKTFGLNEELEAEILKKVDSVKPNTNGFDIIIDEKDIKLVAEVKCVFPSIIGDKYRAAQRNSILDDAIKLINGKKQLRDTTNFQKFLFLINVGEGTDSALTSLLKPSTVTSKNEIRISRNDVKVNIEVLKDKNIDNLSTAKVYLKTLTFE